MLCSRMNLTERRIRVPRPPVEGPIIRPCSTRKLTIDNNNNSSPVTATSTTLPATSSSSSSTSPAPASPSPTPETPGSSAKSLRNSIDIPKTPLIIINLNIPSEVKPLAPARDVNKTPKKLPPFCIQYQNALCNNNSESSRTNHTQFPQFYIRGFEISDQKNGAGRKSPKDTDTQQTSDNEQMDNCSNISVDYNNQFTQNPPNSNAHPICFQNLSNDYMFNLDGYEMDSYGHLPGESRTPTPIPPGYRALSLRTPSPNTRQIIRVDVTVNRDKPQSVDEEKAPSDFNYEVGSVGVGMGLLNHRFSERRGRIRFNKTSSYI